MHVNAICLALRMKRRLARLRRESGGLALIEFALAAPIVLTIGGYGLELSNLSITHMRVSQIALNLADHASRVGLTSTLATTQLREADVNDVMAGARIEGASINLTTNGRVTLSSLENVQQSYDTASVQRIHWQRCIGLKSGTGFDSSYGTTSASAGITATAANAGTLSAGGMGKAGATVSAPQGSGVMFVEINYRYQPIFGTLFVSPTTVSYIASFVVRDKRDYAMIYNPAPAATRATCNTYTG